MRALVFANGDAPSARLVSETLREGDLIVAADAGARHALACGLVPHAVVGDLDSFGEDPALAAAIPADRLHRESRRSECGSCLGLTRRHRHAAGHRHAPVGVVGHPRRQRRSRP